MSSVNVTDLLDRYDPDLGRFLALAILDSSLPTSIPFVMTSITLGRVYGDVLNATEFFNYSSDLAGPSSPDNGSFAMPGINDESGCFKVYKDRFDPAASETFQ